jgi:hypothetical protein
MGTKKTTAYSFKTPTIPKKALTSSSSLLTLATSLLSSLLAASSLASGCESARYSVVKAENAERSALSLDLSATFHDNPCEWQMLAYGAIFHPEGEEYHLPLQ